MLVYELLNMFPANTHVVIRYANGTQNGRIYYEIIEENEALYIEKSFYDDVKNVSAAGKNKIIVTVF